MARKRRKGGRRRRRQSREEAPRRRRRRRGRARRSREAPRRRRRRRYARAAEAPRRRRRRRGGRRRRARAREFPRQVRRTRRGRFTRRRGGKSHGKRYRTRLVGHITGERLRRRRHSRRGAMENPVTGWELVVGLVTGAIGYTAADVIDRLVTMRERKDDKGQALAMRFIEAPLMDDFLPRVGAGVAVAGTPLVVAQFIRSPMGRSALQFFGFGAAVRLVGKAVDDLAAYLFKDSASDSTGKKLFSGEIGQRTAVGLAGAPCSTCGQYPGLGGSCGCRSMIPSGPSTGPSVMPQMQLPQGGPHPTIPPGGGYPPVVNQGPYTPPGGFVPPPAISRQPQVPPEQMPPGIMVPTTPQSPPVSAYAPVGVRGLGDVSGATDVLRSHGEAYVALRKNREVLAAHAAGHATPDQRKYADQLIAKHRGSFATLGQFHPQVLDSAARGLGLVVEEDNSSLRFPGTSRHRRNDEAAE